MADKAPYPTQRSSKWRTQKPLVKNEGAMNGGINIVTDKATGKAYIEKVTKRDEIQRGMAEVEISILRQLKGNDFVVQIADWYLDLTKGREQGGIILEFCTKGSLESLIERHRLNNRPISEQWIWRWACQLAGGLAYCHYGPTYDTSRNSDWNYVIHREQPMYGRRSDVYQLGLVLICLCNLRHVPGTYDRDMPAPKYTSYLNHVIKECLVPVPDKRWTAIDMKNYTKEKYTRLRDSLGKELDLVLPVSAS
ncbi:kinase-like protein [Lophiostoma macrostomum CBS 122681]|uniref:non-specific serine/threonine protein kinase n=1 Tax=Lophiostoma macrostomum CBS 122681 TaxID=1314788 RepID=A0A6A6TN94_9PLEO|nr:kinase-like protein [Lophiostoma macrostomum CBS 122681]